MRYFDELEKEAKKFSAFFPYSIVRIWEGALLIAGINLLIFGALSIILGGDASMGKIEEGRYFLGLRGHYTEVSEAIYTYSKVHGSTVSWSFFLLLGIPGIYLFLKAGATCLLTKQ